MGLLSQYISHQGLFFSFFHHDEGGISGMPPSTLVLGPRADHASMPGSTLGLGPPVDHASRPGMTT